MRNVRLKPSPIKYLGHYWRSTLAEKFSSFKAILAKLNLFKRESCSDAAMRRQLIYTRSFILSFSVIMILLTFYMFVSIQSKTIIIMNPSRTDYDRLYQSHSETLQCICSKSFIPYSDFIEIIPNYHQLCQSDFVLLDWYDKLAIGSEYDRELFFTTWARHAALYFGQLSGFCSLASNTFNETYLTFSTKKLVSLTVIPSRVFQLQADSDASSFIRRTHEKFRASFSIIRSTTYVNQFASATGTNVRFDLRNQKLEMIAGVQSIPNPNSPDMIIGGCQCISEAYRCGFYGQFWSDLLNRWHTLTISLTIRCFPMDIALKSTLECWYNQTCLDAVFTEMARYGIPNNISISALSNDLNTRFPINKYMETIVDEMLMENWSNRISYDAYYQSCAPLSCSYKIEERFDSTVVILTILAVYSGLNKALRLLIPALVRIVLFMIERYRRRQNRVSNHTGMTTIRSRFNGMIVIINIYFLKR